MGKRKKRSIKKTKDDGESKGNNNPDTGKSKDKEGKSEATSKRGPAKSTHPSRRDAAKYPGLNKGFFSKIKQEYHDVDEYAFPLDVVAQEWLSNFQEEDLGANFNHKGEKIYQTVEDKRASYRRNNSRNFDIYSITKATGRNMDISTDEAFQMWQDRYTDLNYEDRLIAEIEDGQFFEEFPLDKDKK